MESASKSLVKNKYFNSCCCCLQDECYKDISTEYNSFGQTEVYVDMIRDTFNIQIDNHETAIDSTHRQLICEPCVSRLREAATFRQMVMDSQKIIQAHLQRAKSSDKECTDNLGEIVIKVEAFPLAETVYEDTAADDNFEDDELLADLKVELLKDAGGDGAPRAPKSRRRSKLKKCKIKPEVEGPAGAGAGAGAGAAAWRRLVERRGPGPLLRDSSLKLLAHSSACVFQWNKSWYRCFCCKEPFSDLASLRDHTASSHTLEQIERKIIAQQNRLVKVDISALHCKLCAQNTENLTELRTHLTEKHNIEFVQPEDLLVPFKINAHLECQICSEKFTVFRLLNMHMNRHYQKHVCHVCGAGFSNSVFLNLHKIRSHRPSRCKECDVVFANKSDKKTHDVSIHGVKFERKLRFPCPYCSQRFYQENFRVQHLVERHGMAKPEFRCEVCAKVFITRSLCNNHVKTVHMKEKNQECDVCHKLFYNKSDVMRHRVTHTGEKKFSCSICNTLFATKDSLRRHARRTHVGMQ